MPVKTKKSTRPTKYRKWQWIYLVEAYRLVRAGANYHEICTQLKIAFRSWENWLAKIPELKEAIAMARREKEEDGQSLHDWVFQRMSPDLQKLWRDIARWDKEKNGVAKIELMLEDRGKKVRQQLFLHALCLCHFNHSEACRRVNISRFTLHEWINKDPDFAALVEEMEWHKGNFYETALIKLVKAGVPGAVIAANRSYNSARGYGKKDKLDVSLNGTVQQSGILDLAELMPYLKHETRLEILDAIEKREQEKGPKLVTAGEVISSQIAQLPLADKETEKVPNPA